MYINITDSATANNKGSSGGLTNYLEKENRLYKKQDPEYWFNHRGKHIEPYEVRRSIDNNIAKLSKTDAKFFLINISPSQKELRYLKEQFGTESAKDQLKIYAEKVMDEYAKNFKRNGIDSAKDLMWFGKLENYRYYTHKDKEVLNGIKKRGERKEGEQMHIQIIVSRKDISNKVKLSPMNNSKGKNEMHSKKLGQFNRVAFKQSGETLFDNLFEFDRKLKDTLVYANIQKNGSLTQREQLNTLELGAEQNYHSKSFANELAKDVAEGLFHSTSGMLQSVGETVAGFLEVLMKPVYIPGSEINPIEEAQKRKRKKRKGQSQGHSR
ncbi:hypothetical protein HDE68_002942 [Pedobacter cryoconitis]|uniref:Molybdopterin-guanine dinucleotide biosynthesis protein MobB n=1 Tax=Pedobacter cryoconitis TaxID=188932 RepID=A0A7W9E085_9SPHI|nr:DUF5712 family protein [Pedobacter cryoconitis]MBB5637029.1 hypothetical protein [Pedobacter cryoconitis]